MTPKILDEKSKATIANVKEIWKKLNSHLITIYLVFTPGLFTINLWEIIP